MFGASEDRARQLAYRKRRDRIISGNSCSTYRSLSSASRISQQSHVSPTLEHETEHSAQRPGNATDPVNSFLPTDPQHSQAEQHRIQTEYLSQVLYDDLSLATTVGPPDRQPAAAPHSGKYGSLGPSTTSRHIRNATAPISYTEIQNVLASSTQSHADLSTLDECFRRQTMASLRGGGSDDILKTQGLPHMMQSQVPSHVIPPLRTQQPNQKNIQEGSNHPPSPYPTPTCMIPGHDSTRQYMQIYPWARRWYYRREWVTPILCGQYLTDFRTCLSDAEGRDFLALFLSVSPDSSAPSAPDARRSFFRNLDAARQDIFRRIIEGRGHELELVERGYTDPQLVVTINLPPPGIMLYHLLEALETPVMSPSIVLGSNAGYNQHMGLSAHMRPEYAQRMAIQPARPATFLNQQNLVPPTPNIPATMQQTLNAQRARLQAMTQQHAGMQPLHTPSIGTQPSNAQKEMMMRQMQMQQLYQQRLNQRSSSAPNFGQQPGQSGYLAFTVLLSTTNQSDFTKECVLTISCRYYSGGNGAGGSSAAKTTLSKVFDKYREDAAEAPDSVGIEGTMKYLTDIAVDLEGLESFAVFEIVQAPAMGEMTRDGFVNGWQERK